MRLMLTFLVTVWMTLLPALAGNRFFRFENAPRDEKLVALLQPQLLRRVGDFHRKLGVYPVDTLRITLAGDEAQYHVETGGDNGIIEYSDAFYRHEDRAIVIRSPRAQHNYERLAGTLFHEYLHAQVDALWPDAPLWFHEGMAVYFSEGIGFERSADFAWNYLFGIRRSIEEMRTEYPQNPGEWNVFYTQSAMAVRYLWSHHQNDFFRFWESGGRGRSFEACFYRSFGSSTRDFSADFERILKREVALQALLASSSIFWGVMPLILFLSYLRRKLWTDPQTYRAWDREEQHALPEKHPETDSDINVQPDDDEESGFRPYLKGRPKFFH